MLDLSAPQEIAKVDNLLTSFGWTIKRQEITETDIILTIKKPTESSLKETSPGPD